MRSQNNLQHSLPAPTLNEFGTVLGELHSTSANQVGFEFNNCHCQYKKHRDWDPSVALLFPTGKSFSVLVWKRVGDAPVEMGRMNAYNKYNMGIFGYGVCSNISVHLFLTQHLKIFRGTLSILGIFLSSLSVSCPHVLRERPFAKFCPFLKGPVFAANQ